MISTVCGQCRRPGEYVAARSRALRCAVCVADDGGETVFVPLVAARRPDDLREHPLIGDILATFAAHRRAGQRLVTTLAAEPHQDPRRRWKGAA